MEMVERVARAILAAHDWTQNDKEDDEPSGWDTLTEDWKECFRAQARAAIEAMRDPSKEMVLAGDIEKDACIDSDWSSDADGNRHDYTYVDSDLPARVWRAMIGAAFKVF